MTPEKENFLFKTFPDIFRERHLPPSQTCMCWGICCGDGWFDLLHDLCSCLVRIQKVSGILVIAQQVKEKFGGLRFYHMIEVTDELNKPARLLEKKEWLNIINAVISHAGRKSYMTCEVTGEWGSLCVNDNWYKTLSTEKAKELGYIELSESEQ